MLEIQKYTVAKGDSVFGIAVEFKIKPETLLWANYATLNDNPDMISPGVELNIPPVDGVYYEVKDGDTLEALAGRFDVKPDDILLWPGNHLDMADPKLTPGEYVLAPGGHREFKQWIVPMVWRPKSGTLKNILGPGGCDVTGGAYGGGAFVWPAGNHYLSGNDFWSGHRGIDIAAGMGAGIYASDTGAVVYAGPIGGGYGNMVMIDHGNGYQTLYAPPQPGERPLRRERIRRAADRPGGQHRQLDRPAPAFRGALPGRLYQPVADTSVGPPRWVPSGCGVAEVLSTSATPHPFDLTGTRARHGQPIPARAAGWPAARWAALLRPGQLDQRSRDDVDGPVRAGLVAGGGGRTDSRARAL